MSEKQKGERNLCACTLTVPSVAYKHARSHNTYNNQHKRNIEISILTKTMIKYAGELCIHKRKRKL